MKGLPNYTINANGRLIDLSNPQVMGILNATPDSFYEGSRKQTEHDIADRANQIVAEGGSMIDIGAFSTRPGAAQVTAEEEMQRMRRALTIVRGQQPDAVLSIDTFRPEIARMAVEEFGAAIINDVSEGNINGAFGGADAKNPNGETESDDSTYPAIFRMVAKLGVPYILMSTHGEMSDIMINLAREVQMLRDLGVKDIILDPGFGFGKTLDQNYVLLQRMDELKAFGLPVLVGTSRKSMIYRLLDSTPAEALNGTTVVNTLSLLKGASILRVHDVKPCVETVKIVEKMLGCGE